MTTRHFLHHPKPDQCHVKCGHRLHEPTEMLAYLARLLCVDLLCLAHLHSSVERTLCEAAARTFAEAHHAAVLVLRSELRRQAVAMHLRRPRAALLYSGSGTRSFRDSLARSG